MASEDVLPVKDLLEKAATIKRFEYLLLGSELKKQSDIAKDQYKFFKEQINNNSNYQGRRWCQGRKGCVVLYWCIILVSFKF